MITFVQPAFLWLLLLLVPLWALALLDPRRVPALRRWLSLGLRSIIFAALVLALAGAQAVQRSSNLTTVFVIDNSDSVAPALRAKADQYVQTALDHMPPDDQAAIVVFGKDAVVERAPSGDRQFARTSVAPPSDQTDVHRALQLALAMLSVHSPDALRRAVGAGDADALTLVPGVGRKGAARLVLELRGKLGVGGAAAFEPPAGGEPGRAAYAEVREALAALGCQPAEIKAALESLPADAGELPTEELLRLALRNLGPGGVARSAR